MTENVGSGLTPQGNRFEDQHTSAPADLSAGGVATALDSLQGEPVTSSPPPAPSHHWSPPSNSLDYSSPLATPTQTRSLTQPRALGLGAGALLSIGGAIGGAWLYARWQREQNRPINRLRRGARDVAGRIGERMPDVEDLPRGAAPMSGAATALVLTGLLASRAMRRDPANRADEVRDQASDVLRDTLREALERGREAMERGKDVRERGRSESRRFVGRLPMDRLSSRVEPRRPAVLGIGFGGLAVLAGGAYLVWRLMRGGSASASWTAYSTE